MRIGGHNDRVADRQEMEELLGNRRQGWHRVWLDHQGDLELVESCLQSGEGEAPHLVTVQSGSLNIIRIRFVVK